MVLTEMPRTRNDQHYFRRLWLMACNFSMARLYTYVSATTTATLDAP